MLAIPAELFLPIVSLFNPLTNPKGLTFESAQSLHVVIVQICPAGCLVIMLAGTFMGTVPEELILCKMYKLNTEVWLSQGSASHSEQVTDSTSNFPD